MPPNETPTAMTPGEATPTPAQPSAMTPAPAAETPPATPAATPETPPAETPPATPATPASAETPGAETPPSNDDWRRMLAGDNDERYQALQQYQTPQDYDKVFRDNQTAAREKAPLNRPPGEGATEDQIKSFRDSWSIPEAADGYTLPSAPDGLEISEGDQAFMDSAIAKLHARNDMSATPDVINTFAEMFYEASETRAAQLVANGDLVAEQTQDTMKKTWGENMSHELNYAIHAGRAAFGDKFAEIMNLTLADGSRIGDNFDFINGMNKLGRMSSEDLTFLDAMNDMEGMTSQGIDEEIERIRGWRHGTPDEVRKYEEATKPGGRYPKLLERQKQLKEAA